MDLGLTDKVILVTGGAGGGIGEGIARACMAEGAHVVTLGRSTDLSQRFEEEMSGSNAKCTVLNAELADTGACRQAIESIVERHGTIDGIVNNAGVNDGIGLERSPDDFMDSIRTNLVHYFALVHYALPALKQARGTILNIASKVALTGQGGTSAYAAAKGAQLALTREWAVDLLPFGIRVNAIVPAEVMTPAYRTWLNTLQHPQAAEDKITERIPLEHRMTTVAEIASAAVFLLSPTQSSHTTGQFIHVDGGYVHLDRALI